MKESAYLLNFVTKEWYLLLMLLFLKMILLFMMLIHMHVSLMVFVYTWENVLITKHNDLESMEKTCKCATKMAAVPQVEFYSLLKVYLEIAECPLEKLLPERKIQFRLLVDDAHGFGTPWKKQVLEQEKSKVKTELMYFSTATEWKY